MEVSRLPVTETSNRVCSKSYVRDHAALYTHGHGLWLVSRWISRVKHVGVSRGAEELDVARGRWARSDGLHDGTMNLEDIFGSCKLVR